MHLNVNRWLTLSKTTRHVVLLGHGSLLLAYRPVLLRHTSFGKVEHGHIRYKGHGLVHRVELNGIVQKEEIGVLMRVPFHLANQCLLLLPVHSA